MTMSEVRLADISKAFGNTRAVDGVSLQVHSGELLSVLEAL